MAWSSTENGALDGCMRQIAKGNTKALEKLYKAVSQPVYAYALSILKNPQDAEDVLHDSFLLIWRNAPAYRTEGKPMAWILTVTRNQCFKKLRQQKRYISMADWETAVSFHEESLSAEEKLLLQACMNLLTEEERQIVILHAVAGLKHRQIAQFLEIPLSTALSKYHRAIKKMKNDL